MIIVSGLNMVEKLVETRDIGRVIGLLAGNNEHPVLPALAASGNHLKLTMHDIAMPVDGMQPPGGKQIEELIAFVADWDRQKPMLVHCWAGISRSTASAYIAQCILNPQKSETTLAGELRELSAIATPNRLIIAHADAILGRGGRMSAAIADIGRGANAFEGNVFEWAV